MRQTVQWAVVAAALTAASIGTRASRGVDTEQPAPIKLLVILVVDQLRFDYLDTHARFWTGGFKRLMTEGAVFDRAFYPYLNTVTCAGHATIATGTLPYAHGVIMNEWYQRAERRRMSCTEDPSATSVPYAGPAEPFGHSAHRLRTQTIGDRLRAAHPSARVVALSMKPRSTVMLAGHGGKAVTWFADSNVWGTSTAYASAPVPEVRAFLDANPLQHQRTAVWDRMRPATEYASVDEVAYERPPSGWTNTFPHPLNGRPGTPSDRFFDLWERSPYSDDYLARMAAHLIRAYKLGRGEHPDYLGISFSALDYVGHAFGPESHEVQDTLIRLDRTIGDLFAVLDSEVGRGGYVVALSSDHGVAPIPEGLRARGEDAGRVLNPEVAKVAEAAMTAAHGAGPHVALVEYANVYLTPTARERLANDASYVQPLIDAVSNMPGVERVFISSTLAGKRNSGEPIERAAALSYHPDESGDVTVILKPNWVGTNTSAATHGSARAYDQHVPVVFWGPPFRGGRYSTPASPADLAPTLASVIRLPMPGADGQVLKNAFVQPPEP
jgi:predicted AlkP superfamily pyrophosphatase or phosphodiesterase